MKTTIFFTMLCFLWINVIAQAPQAIKYQAVVRDGSGSIMANKTVFFKISILNGSPTGAVIYKENHTEKTTNAFGLIDLEIGKGASELGTFSAINWGSGSYFIKVEIFPAGATSWQEMGTTQLLSVPYALYAKDVQNKDDADADPSNEIQSLSLAGNNLSLSKGGGTVAIPGDNWGTDVVKTDATLAGNGTTATSLKIADNGITSAKIVDNSIQSADLMDNTITSIKIANGAVTTDKLAANSITTEKINAGAVTGTKISQAGATTGQALKWNGTIWSPADDATGSGLTLPYSGTASSLLTTAFQVTNNTGDGIKGIAVSAGKTGLIGEAPNQGIFGNATAASGAAYGVQGTSASSVGSGVTGYSSSTTGLNFGVRGLSGSNEGKGVYGYAFSGTGYTFGVYGESASPSGSGVKGFASSGFGITYGVFGESASDEGIGVFGYATSTSTGGSCGVSGLSSAPYGWGVSGNGNRGGISGGSNSTDGMGVYGKAFKGVYGESSSVTGIGVHGNGFKGVYGESSSNNGFGVYGKGQTALYGTTSAINGYGVNVVCTDAFNIPRGVCSTVASDNGYSGYFSGGKFYVSGKVGIGTTSPLYNLVVLPAVDGSTDIVNFNDINNSYCFRFRHASNGAGAFYVYDGSGNNTILLYGDGNSFINSGNLGIGTTNPVYKLQVGVAGDGTQARANAWNLLSDARLKKDFSHFTNPLDMVNKINGYYFYWNTGKDKTRQVGFSAQEVQKVIPEVVSKGGDGYLSVEYGKMAPILVEAIKELKAENDRLKAENEQVIIRIEKLEKLTGISSMK